MITVKQFYRGTAIRIKAKCKLNGVATDPDSLSIIIKDSAGTAVITANGESTNVIGTWQYIWQTTGTVAFGLYTVEVTAGYSNYSCVVKPNLFRVI